MSSRLAAHLALGDSPAAYEDFHAGLRLYTALEKEPTLIAGLVRLSILAFEENAVGSGLLRQQWGDAELAKIIADLSRLRLMDDYAFGLGSERGLSNLVHEQFLGKDARAAGPTSSSACTASNRRSANVWAHPWSMPSRCSIRADGFG